MSAAMASSCAMCGARGPIVCLSWATWSVAFMGLGRLFLGASEEVGVDDDFATRDARLRLLANFVGEAARHHDDDVGLYVGEVGGCGERHTVRFGRVANEVLVDDGCKRRGLEAAAVNEAVEQTAG